MSYPQALKLLDKQIQDHAPLSVINATIDDIKYIRLIKPITCAEIKTCPQCKNEHSRRSMFCSQACYDKDWYIRSKNAN